MSDMNFHWWWSIDQERYSGPCDSAEQALAEGRCSYPESTIYVVEARQGPLCGAIFDDLDVRFDDANDENGDPDGDAVSCDVPDAACRDLEDRLNDVMHQWIIENNLHSWMFSETRNASEHSPEETTP